MKLERTHVFIPTEFERPKSPTHLDVNAGEAFCDLLLKLGEFCKSLELEDGIGAFCNGVPAGMGNDYFVWKKTDNTKAIEIKLPPGIAHAANNLYYAFLSRLQREYEAGLADGTKLLQRLASGDVTINEVNAIGEKRNK